MLLLDPVRRGTASVRVVRRVKLESEVIYKTLQREAK